MKTKILIIACFFLSTFIKAQMKDGAILVNEKQKKIFSNGGQSANKAWYTIYQKDKDTVLQKTYITDKSKLSAVLDSLKKDGFADKFKTEKVSGSPVKLKLLEHRFYKTDTVKKAPGKVIVDSIFTSKIMVTITSEKEKLNKTRIYSQKYTSLNKAKTEEKIKKYKDFSLIKYTDAGIYELNLLFDKLFILSPDSYYKSFETNEKEFF